MFVTKESNIYTRDEHLYMMIYWLKNFVVLCQKTLYFFVLGQMQ